MEGQSNNQEVKESMEATKIIVMESLPAEKIPSTLERVSSNSALEQAGVYQTQDTTFNKSKSLTELQNQKRDGVQEDLATAVDRLKSETPPASLQEVRVRRQSIKEERKETIAFIRRRTASRASASGARPVLDGSVEGEQLSR